MFRKLGVTVDVTTIIGAQEYIVSRNQERSAEDPFARECFVEAVQTLIFNTDVYVAHPVLTAPRATDFGDEPYLLRCLFARGLIRPLRLSEQQVRDVDTAEVQTMRFLTTDGPQVLSDYIKNTQLCDAAPGATAIASRIKAWSDFQARQVRTAPGHHVIRVPTTDGIETDDFGAWSKAAATTLRGRVRAIAPEGDEAHVIAFLTRGLKYQARSVVGAASYQAHPARRDFIMAFELAEAEVGRHGVLDVVKIVRGIHETLLDSIDDRLRPRMLLLAYELPLLGGRLWTQDEVGRRPDHDWIDQISDRIADYKARTAQLRAAITNCLAEEDQARLIRDIAEVKFQLLERLGLIEAKPSALERDLSGAAIVAETVAGVPKVSSLLIGVKNAGKRAVFRGYPYQQFLYKEFLSAWRRTGR